MMRHSETMPAASRLLLSHPIVCLLAVMAAVVVLEVIGPLDVVRAADIAVEGESLNRPASGTSLITGAGYSGGAALKFTANVAASHTVNCSTPCDVVLMASGGQSGGQATFSVNGSTPQALTSSTTTAYTFHLPAGATTISVKAGGTGTGHNAFLDVAKFSADGGGGTPSAACADGLDNDSDGKIDLNDLGCSYSTDNDETDPLAMPSETPDQTPMVNGTVRAIQQVGTNIWVGGKFTQVKQREGTVVANVSNVAVFDSQTGEYVDIAPKLGGTGSEVWDMSIYGDDVLVAGTFAGPTSTQKNLVRVDGTTRKVEQWYNAPSLKSVLAAPDLGKIYGGGVSLTAFELSGTKLWTTYKTTVNTTLYPDAPTPGYRDLELDADGQTIWAACACDAVDGKVAKALVKLRTDGVQDTSSWLAEADPASWGMSLVEANGALYLGAGGSDYLAKYDNGPTATGSLSWRRDTSGSVQVVEVMDGQLVIGGHFWEVADQPDDSCGHGRSTDTLDPNNECQTRKGIAAYSFEDEPKLADWSPAYEGKYSLVWALHVDGASLYTGGEFLTVNGVTQNYYARLS
jgi:hypothetical protein